MLSGIAGSVAGSGLAQYSGRSLWLPGGIILITFLVFAKTRFKPRYFAGAIMVLSGHFVWFVLGAAFTGAWSAVMIDVSLMGAALAWLWMRPNLVVVLVASGFTLLALIMNAGQALAAAIGSSEHRALVLHLALRVLTLVALTVGYRRFRKLESALREPRLGSESL